jgi:hypothetical protein
MSETEHTEPILGGFRRYFFDDADAFLEASEADPPSGYAKCCSGGWVGSRDLFIDYLVSPTPAKDGIP